MGNLIDIQNQISKLQKQASDIKAREFNNTVQDIVAKMQAYGITIKDLQAAAARRGAAKGKAAGGVRPKGSKKAAGTVVPAKYRGPQGETWSGRGLMPRWMRTLVEQGQSKDSFLIKP